jgi:hypothetical protein
MSMMVAMGICLSARIFNACRLNGPRPTIVYPPALKGESLNDVHANRHQALRNEFATVSIALAEVVEKI